MNTYGEVIMAGQHLLCRCEGLVVRIKSKLMIIEIVTSFNINFLLLRVILGIETYPQTHEHREYGTLKHYYVKNVSRLKPKV